MTIQIHLFIPRFAILHIACNVKTRYDYRVYESTALNQNAFCKSRKRNVMHADITVLYVSVMLCYFKYHLVKLSWQKPLSSYMYIALSSSNLTGTKSYCYDNRSVDELTAFYILRWVNNVFHILLKIWHIIVWFGPNCLGKSTQSFRIYDMIKIYAEMSFSPCVYNRKNVCCQSHYMNMATSGCDVYLLLYFMPVLT